MVMSGIIIGTTSQSVEATAPTTNLGAPHENIAIYVTYISPFSDLVTVRYLFNDITDA